MTASAVATVHEGIIQDYKEVPIGVRVSYLAPMFWFWTSYNKTYQQSLIYDWNPD